MKIGEKIRYFGEFKYGSVKDFSEAMEMKPPNLQAYLNGSRKPGTDILKKLQRLGCNMNWLLNDAPFTGYFPEYTDGQPDPNNPILHIYDINDDIPNAAEPTPEYRQSEETIQLLKKRIKQLEKDKKMLLQKISKIRNSILRLTDNS